MTMEKSLKELLLRDLCARLPYGVRVKSSRRRMPVTLSLDVMTDFHLGCSVKPYLRPMSSMTEEELAELAYEVFQQPDIDIVRRWVFENKSYSSIDGNPVMVIDWLLAHHFDFRNLISKNLAIKVTEENNPYENDF